MKRFARNLLAFLTAGAAVVLAVAAVVTGGYYYVEPSLPHADELRDIKLQIPLRVYTRDGRLIGQFGEQMRTPVRYEDIPSLLIDAVLAAEDDRFFEHPGLDYAGTARAVFNFLRTGDDTFGGGSTITQQVAKNQFLSRDVTLVRKFKEWILAFRIEREFTKKEILDLYLNTTFYGQRSFGILAAARTYFGKEIDDLTLSEAAIIAGIPQGPSIMNPITSPENAGRRRAYVLRRMLELRKITNPEYQAALAEPIVSQRHGLELALNAPYVAEMVRAEMVRRFGQAAYTAGLKVTTTLDSRLQLAANKAIRDTLIAYDERHGYRGPVAHVELPAKTASGEIDQQRLRELLADYPSLPGLETAIVQSVDESGAQVYFPTRGVVPIGLEAVAWAAPYVNDSAVGNRPQAVSDVLTPGDIVRFREMENGTLRLAELPEVQGAFVALDPQDGAITSLSGGFDFFLSKYNRATQSKRQPGSAFKPFVYSAALENGFTTADIVLDAPLTIDDPGLETVWKPENYGNRFYGPVRLREALVESLNAASVRVILKAGIGNTVRYVHKFGFDDLAAPANASLALGAGNLTPVSLAAGYAVFANGGYRVTPYFIDRVEDADGDVLYRAMPAYVCSECDEPAVAEEAPGTINVENPQPALIDDVTDLYPPLRLAPRVITAQNAYLVTDMMKDVVRRGTGAAAYRTLGRDDLAGKTGTTDELRDAWFAGFNPDVVAASWVGFDLARPLGGREQGGVTAIPMWIMFMQEALAGVPERGFERPPGIIDVRINPDSGLVASGADPNSIFEKFRIGHVPEQEPVLAFPPQGIPAPSGDSAVPPTEKIF